MNNSNLTNYEKAIIMLIIETHGVWKFARNELLISTHIDGVKYDFVCKKENFEEICLVLHLEYNAYCMYNKQITPPPLLEYITFKYGRALYNAKTPVIDETYMIRVTKHQSGEAAHWARGIVLSRKKSNDSQPLWAVELTSGPCSGSLIWIDQQQWKEIESGYELNEKEQAIANLRDSLRELGVNNGGKVARAVIELGYAKGK